MKPGKLVNVLKDRYSTEPAARTVLMQIEFPVSAIPRFETADTFWPAVLAVLDAKLSRGSQRLVHAMATDNPGSPEVAELISELIGELLADLIDPEPTRVSIPVPADPGPARFPRQLGVYEAPDEPDQPPPPPGLAEAAPGSDRRVWPTLTLVAEDRSDEFLQVARELLGPAVDQLYVTQTQTALSIPDPGDEDEAIRREVEECMRAYTPACRVTFRRYSFRPYLYVRLEVCGPDTGSYEATSVPATSTAEDVAEVLMAEMREAASSGEGLVRVVINHESRGLSRRLNPYTTLHESGVADGDRLRVAPHAVAGSIAPQRHLAAVHRALGQLRVYAGQEPAFAVESVDDEVLPERVTVSIGGFGLAPPPAGQNADPLPVRSHRVAIHLGPMYPIEMPRIIWQTPVFHPNIRATAADGCPAGTVQFQPLLWGYRPDRDLAVTATMLIQLARYRDYDLSDGDDAPNPAAAGWARTEAGQTLIKQIGGRLWSEVDRHRDRSGRPVRPFLITLFGGVPDGVRSGDLSG